ncbi:MAG TPA: sodium:proton antiporter, partial [Clostridiales bacterium]|nr:sodium:proton antiporter [Clostridiales bacterium]
MNNQAKEKKQPSLLLSILPVIVTIIFLAIAIKIEADIHIPRILGATFTSVIAVFVLGYKWVEIEEGIVASISSTMQAILILAIIGVIIGTWIIGG